MSANAVFAHKPVLLEASIEALLSQSHSTAGGGCYLDCTFGRGGHSAALLSSLDAQARLIGIDQDPVAVEVGNQWQDPRFEMVYSSFADLAEVVRLRGLWGAVSGVFFDLGVSSPQLDDPNRGFAFQQDGPLDMRMNHHQGPTAAEWLSGVAEDELVRVLKTYGEERFAKRIANSIVTVRAEQPISTTKQLADIVSRAIPRHEKHKHPATRTFQAIRIALNGELDALDSALNDALELLGVGGHLVVISFHSLEDRMVKRFMQRAQRGDDHPRDMPIMAHQIHRRLQIMGKAIKPSEAEVAQNPRARSAMLRVAKKL